MLLSTNVDSPSYSSVGGDTTDVANLIAQNGTGVEVKGDEADTLWANSNHSNQLPGIDLVTAADSDGPTPNDPGAGPNNLLNAPVITSGQFGPDTFVAGTLDSVPREQFVLDFYVSATATPNDLPRGLRWLGSANVTTDAVGDASFKLLLRGGTVSAELVRATASRIDANGNTTDASELSAAYQLDVGVGISGCTLQIHATASDDTIYVQESKNQYRVTASFLPIRMPLTFAASQRPTAGGPKSRPTRALPWALATTLCASS